MAKQPFSILCTSCKNEVGFDIDDVDGLDTVIDDERNEAAVAARDEFKDFVDLGDLTGGRRPLWEMSAALRRGDIGEAEYWLDRIAEEIGARAIEDVQQARFSIRARKVA
ncbi:hypothetical protein [uncultured Novosphingobium sp.]|uniref:hypothetical protein n=1 Tax=uncultured Novosphingobium sp. TaxID=292277 RepID=UPI003749BFA1